MQVREAKNVFGQMLNSDACRPAAPLPFPTATRQLMDLFLPSLAVMLNTLFTCKATTTTSTQPSTPSKCLHQLWRILQGEKLQREIRADAAETDGCNNAPKTPGGSSDTLQMKDADSGNTRPLSQRRSSRTEVKKEKKGEERKRNGWWQRVNQPLQLRNVTAINKTQRMN